MAYTKHVRLAESPRWLLSKGRVDDAKRALNRLRRKQDVADGTTEAELEALQTALQESNESTFASPVKLLSGNNPRRLFVRESNFSATCLQTDRGHHYRLRWACGPLSSSLET